MKKICNICCEEVNSDDIIYSEYYGEVCSLCYQSLFVCEYCNIQMFESEMIDIEDPISFETIFICKDCLKVIREELSKIKTIRKNLVNQ